MEDLYEISPQAIYDRETESLVNTKTLYLAIQGHIKSYLMGIQRNILELVSGLGKVEALPLRPYHPLVTLDRPLMTMNRFRDPSKLHRKSKRNMLRSNSLI